MTDFENDIKKSIEVLQNGGIILYPTDTVWGIGCDATNEEAVEKIIALKQRPGFKSFVMLAASEKDILKYTAAPDISIFEYLEKADKPTTVIYENALGLAQNAIAEDGSVGMRICRDEFCRHLIKRFRKPLISTSANISGDKTPSFFAEINKNIFNGVDYTVQYRQNDFAEAKPSVIIKWIKGEVVVIRK